MHLRSLKRIKWVSAKNTWRYLLAHIRVTGAPSKNGLGPQQHKASPGCAAERLREKNSNRAYTNTRMLRSSPSSMPENKEFYMPLMRLKIERYFEIHFF